MQLFDSHCHLDRVDLTGFNHSFDHFMQQAHEQGMREMLCVSISPDSWHKMTELVQPYLQPQAERPQVWLSYGLHPTADPGRVIADEQLYQSIIENPLAEHIVAVGETGLDYFHSGKSEQWQHERFIHHIQAARELNKPVIIHSRAAREDTIATLEQQQARDCGGVLHCFAENWDMARRALDIGFYISFSGIVTYKSAQEIQEVARKMPLDRLLIETDSPYLSPVPHRGKTNNPMRVRHIAEMIAALRGCAPEEIAQQARENTYRWLQLEPPQQSA